jgi:Fur family ferric uptake transcriptional regulator
MALTRNTQQRRDILQALAHLDGFVSAQELHARITRDGATLALATVYTQLKKLVTSEEVDVVMTDRGEALYRRCEVNTHHHHLACRRCGTTVEVDAPELEKWANALAKRFHFTDVRHVLELNGVCEACRAK